MNRQEDLDLVNCILLKKDRTAENKLYSKYYKKILFKVKSFRHDTENAKDIASDIMIKIFNNLNSYTEKKSSFGSWVMSITNNHLIDIYRKDKNKIETISFHSIPDDFDQSKNKLTHDITYSIDDELQARDRVDYILGTLKDEESKLLVLKFHYGYDNTELGYHYNTTNDGISFKINYIKKKIQNR